MDITKEYRKQQEAKRLHNRIFSFIDDFKIGTMMNKSGIRKLWGASPLALFTAIFMLPFEGKTFSRESSIMRPCHSKRMLPFRLFRCPKAGGEGNNGR